MFGESLKDLELGKRLCCQSASSCESRSREEDEDERDVWELWIEFRLIATSCLFISTYLQIQLPILLNC